MPKMFLPQINRERKNKIKAEVLKNDQTKEIFFSGMLQTPSTDSQWKLQLSHSIKNTL